MLVALRDVTPARGLFLGFVYGLTGFGITLSWLMLFGTLAWGALTLLTALSIALFGAAFLIGCDVVARTAMSPVELPVGVITAIIGGPFFLWLLVRKS